MWRCLMMYICVTTMCWLIVDVVGDCIYVKWWWIVVDCIYTNCWWWWGDLFVWTYAFIADSYFHAFMTDGGGFYIQLRWLWCFCCIMGDDLEEIWYHMHIWVELGAYHIAWVLMVVCEWQMLMISVLVNYMLAIIWVIKWLYMWRLMFLMIKWELNWFIYVKLFILIMIDVILTFSGFDRLPVCMDG
jgi:hypothetical protein